MFDDELIGGVLVQYFVTCKREAWLYAHKIHPMQDDENILIGKALAEIKEEREFDSFEFSNLKFDKISKERGHYLITEYKKSLKNREGAKMQLLYYLYLLKKGLNLKHIDGKVISAKSVIFVEGSEENFKKIEELISQIKEFVSSPNPPPPKEIPFCKECGYRDYCF